MTYSKRIALNSLLLALICVASWIVIPSGILLVPISTLTMALVLVSFLRPASDTFFIVLLFLIIEALNLPVVALGSSRIFGPTGGYHLAFLIAFPLLSLALSKTQSIFLHYLLSLVITLPIIYCLGSLVLSLFFQKNFEATLLANAIFIPFDCVKYLLALLAAQGVKKII